MNTSVTSRNTTMTCTIEQKKKQTKNKTKQQQQQQKPQKKTTTLKRTTCVGEDSYNQGSGGGQNATPRSVVVQTEQGSQRRNHTQLRRRSWNQKATQPATPRATGILPKQNRETRTERNNEQLAEGRTTTRFRQPEERPDTCTWNRMVKRQCTHSQEES